MTDDQVAAIAKALGHPARIRILRTLASQDECKGAELFGDLSLAQSTVSQHLAVLREAGLVTSRSIGQSSVYCLAAEPISAFTDAVSAIIADAPACVSGEGGCK